MFSKDGVIISKDGTELYKANKRPEDRTWSLPLPKVANKAYLAIHNTSHAEMVKFLSATFCNPADSTLQRAIRNKWLIYPNVTSEMVAKNLPNTIETAKI